MEVVARGRGSLQWGESVSLTQIRRAIAGGLTALVAVCAVLLLSRRIAGALVEPPSIPALILTVTMGCLVAIAAGFINSIRGDESARSALFVAATAAISLLLLGIALSIPGASPFGVLMMWLVIAGAEAALLTQYWQRSRGVGTSNLRFGLSRTPQVSDSAADESDADWQALTSTQRLNYHRRDDGRLAVDGWIRLDFVADQRTVMAHVAFCPAFEERPKLEAEPLVGPACEVRPTLVLPWGVRWEVRLDAPAAVPTSVVLGFSASESLIANR
jgi:hypothetical protein